MKLIRALALTLGVCAGAFAQNAVPIPYTKIQFFDNNGVPLAGGKVCTYQAGTSTPLATYTDATASVANPNPVILDSSGRAAIWIGAQSLKVQLMTAGTDNTCSTGTILWTQDQVRDVGLLNTPAINVKAYGAKGDGVTDDTAAIAAACTAVGGGQLVFPPATYKIATGNITTCALGISLSGYGATFDLTTLSSAGAFAFNVGGSFSATAPTTLLSGFRVLGSGSTSAWFARADNAPYFTLRDINAKNVQVADIRGQSYQSNMDHVTILNPVPGGIAFSYTQGGYAGTPDGSVLHHPYCASATATGATCIEVDGAASPVLIDDPFIADVTTGVRMNGGAAQINLGTFILRSYAMRGIAIDSLTQPYSSIGVNGAIFEFLDSATNADIAIDNNNANLTNSIGTSLTLGGARFVNQAASGAAVTLVRSSQDMSLTMTGSNYVSYGSAPAGSVVDPESTVSFQNSTFSGNTFSTQFGSNTLNFTKPGTTGQLNVTTISGNQFWGVNNFKQLATSAQLVSNQFTASGALAINIAGGFGTVFSNNVVSGSSVTLTATGGGESVVTGNNFSSGTTINLSNSGINSLLVGNSFGGAPTVSPVPGVCANNVGYGCT